MSFILLFCSVFLVRLRGLFSQLCQNSLDVKYYPAKTLLKAVAEKYTKNMKQFSKFVATSTNLARSS